MYAATGCSNRVVAVSVSENNAQEGLEAAVQAPFYMHCCQGKDLCYSTAYCNIVSDWERTEYALSQYRSPLRSGRC